MVDDIAALVRRGISGGANGGNVLVVGHSKGAAVANLVAVCLQQRVDGATVTGRFFASPRIGNAAWANYADRVLGTRAWHIQNKDDVVAGIPLEKVGDTSYRHMSGEVWINPDGRYVLCEGQENPKCARSIPVIKKSIAPHNGPYAGVMMADCND